MISIESIVMVVLYLLGAGLIFGLLNYLIDYVVTNFPTAAPFGKFAKIALMILAVLMLISVILSFMGHPVVAIR